MQNNNKNIILGAGPTGLGCAISLVENGVDKKNIILIEKSEQVGGLSGSFKYDNTDLIDYGPHRLAPTINKVLQIAKDACGDDLIEKKSDHGVYINKKLYNFPPKILQWLDINSQKFIFLTTFGLIYSKLLLIISKKKELNFRNSLENIFGKYFYNKIIDPMAKKVWGRSDELDVSFVNNRFSQLKISQFLMKKIIPRRDLNPENFFYPKHGYQQIWDGILKKKLNNINLRIKNFPKKIVIENNKVKRIILNEDELIVDNSDSLVSTIPIYNLIQCLENFDVSKIVKEMSQIKIRSMYLFIYKFNQLDTLPIRTLIFPQKNIIFNRIFEQNKYSRETVENNKSVIIGDITFDIDKKPFENEDIKKIALEEISKLSFIDLNKLESFETKFVKFAYVVPTVKSLDSIRFIEKELSKIENLYIAGRFGAGDYDNSDYALMSGYNIGNFLTGKINKDEFKLNKSKNKKNIIVG